MHLQSSVGRTEEIREINYQNIQWKDIVNLILSKYISTIYGTVMIGMN